MFSRREREYLRRVCGAPGLDPVALSPGYRRKLHWSIRRKVSRALSDWELYLSAAEHEDRVLLPAPVDRAAVPLYSDPIVTMGRRVRNTLLRRSGPKRERTPRGR